MDAADERLAMEAEDVNAWWELEHMTASEPGADVRAFTPEESMRIHERHEAERLQEQKDQRERARTITNEHADEVKALCQAYEAVDGLNVRVSVGMVDTNEWGVYVSGLTGEGLPTRTEFQGVTVLIYDDGNTNYEDL